MHHPPLHTRMAAGTLLGLLVFCALPDVVAQGDNGAGAGAGGGDAGGGGGAPPAGASPPDITPIPEAFPQFSVKEVFPNDTLVSPLLSYRQPLQELLGWTELTPTGLLFSLSGPVRELVGDGNEGGEENHAEKQPILILAPTAQAWLRFFYRLVVPPLAKQQPELVMVFMQTFAGHGDDDDNENYQQYTDAGSSTGPPTGGHTTGNPAANDEGPNSPDPHSSEPDLQNLFNEKVFDEVFRTAKTLVHGITSSIPVFEDMFLYHLVPGNWPEPRLNTESSQLTSVPTDIDSEERPHNLTERAVVINVTKYPLNITDPLKQSFGRRLYRQIATSNSIISIIDEVLIPFPLDELRKIFNVSAHIDLDGDEPHPKASAAATPHPSGLHSDMSGEDTLSAFMEMLGQLTGSQGGESSSSNPNPLGISLPNGVSVPPGITQPFEVSLPSDFVLPTNGINNEGGVPYMANVPFLGVGPPPFFPNVTGAPNLPRPFASDHPSGIDQFSSGAARKLPLHPLYPGLSVRHMLSARADMHVFNSLLNLAPEVIRTLDYAGRTGFPVHVFAPTDTAFFALIEPQWQPLLQILSTNNPGAVEEFAGRVRSLWGQLEAMPSLADILLYHVVNTSASLSSLAGVGKIATMSQNLTESIQVTDKHGLLDADSSRPQPGLVSASYPTLTGFVSVSERVLTPFNTAVLTAVMVSALEAMADSTPKSSPTANATVTNKSSGSCVNAGARVWVVKDGGGASKGGLQMGHWIEVERLRAGDVTAIGGGKTSPVIGFSHRSATTLSRFVQISLEDGKRLTISEGHYIYANGRLTAAGAARRGDAVRIASGSDAFVRTVQRGIWARGLFAPHTMHGDIVVDGFVVSGYTTEVAPSLAHALLAPARLAFRLGLVRDALGDVLRDGGGWVGRWMPKGKLRY